MSASMSGSRIKALRQALGLSQVQFAALLGVSNVTVNRWEHDRVLPQSGAIERLVRLEQGGLAALRNPRGADRGNLPAVFTPLVGRESDLEALPDLIEVNRLVTITGTAGAGKTRLAIEVGQVSAHRWPDGVWWVDLAAVLDPGDVWHAVARTLGLWETGRTPLADRLADEFRARQFLVILDNCEHLRAACADLAARLIATQGASRLLATSRVPLDIPGEATYALPPLPPDDAIALFVQRVRDYQPELMPTAAQSQAIAEICRRLDRLPLAIELAAARARVLAVEQIAGRIDQRFDLLRTTGAASARQRALETAIDWSYDLLSDEEATLFRQLGVFAGWFDLAVVEAVAETPAALDTLESLSRQSLIVVKHDPALHSARYSLLESLAAYARRLLDARGEMSTTARRHARYYRSLAQDFARGWRGPNQTILLAAVDREHDNLIAALEWTLSAGESAQAIAIGSALGPYWRLRGRFAEGAAWLSRALAGAPATADPARIAALNQLGLLLYHTGRFDEAERALSEAIALARELGDRGEEALARDTLGLVLAGQLELDRARESHERALALFLEVGDRSRAALSKHYLGNLANLRGDRAAAESAYHEAWSLAQGTGDTAAEALILSNLGEVAARSGRYRRALAYFERARKLLRSLGDPDRLAVVTINTAEVQLVLGHRDSAVALIANAVAQLRAIGHPAHLAGATYIQGAALAAVGQRAAALTALRESLALYHQMADWIDVAYSLEAIARLLAAGPDVAQAARLLGAADVIRERERVADYPLFDYAGTIAAVRAALGGDALAQHWAAGRQLLPEAAVAEAMLVGSVADGEPVQLLIVQRVDAAVPHDGASLTTRQIDVLRLVAEGKSNREIGRILHISARTVERHLTAIYAALGVDRRSAAVAVASAAGLLEER